jgi:ribosomal protein L37AE/L43A
MSIEVKLKELETITCSNCKMYEMKISVTNLWCCSNCGNQIRNTPEIDRTKYISPMKLKKYILSQSDETVSKKIIAKYLKYKKCPNEIIYNEKLISNLLQDLKLNHNFRTHKLFNLKDICLNEMT